MTTRNAQFPVANPGGYRRREHADTGTPRVTAHSRRRLTEPAAVRWTLIGITLLFLLLFLVLPMGVVFLEAFRNGLEAYARAIDEPDALAALKLTLIAAGVAVPMNML